ncbi:MAG: BrnA antitoxin family protein, partial [Sulfurifustaceae bacterium]
AKAVVRRGLNPIEPKEQVTLRLDADVLKWFRSRGRGYQTQINALLRAYMEAHRNR